MTAPRTGCAARLMYPWWTVTSPEGETYDLCSGACLLSLAVHGVLPADPSTRSGQAEATTESSDRAVEGAAA
jgi:hypothetical protein